QRNPGAALDERAPLARHGDRNEIPRLRRAWPYRRNELLAVQAPDPVVERRDEAPKLREPRHLAADEVIAGRAVPEPLALERDEPPAAGFPDKPQVSGS